MLAYLRRLVEERTSLTEIQTRMADAAAADGRELSEQDRAEVARMQTRCAELDAQIEQHNGQLESQRAYAGLLERIEQNQPQVPQQRGGNSVQLDTTSPGQAFVESEQFRAYSGHGTSSRYQVEDYLPLETRVPITTANLAIQPYVWTNQVPITTAPLLELLGHVRVSSGVVEWVEIGGNPLAAVVAEGAVKPEAALTYTPQSATLDTLAHWVQITRQALEDGPQIRSIIEGKLRRGLLNKVEADAAAQLVASATIQQATGADLSAAIRVGIGQVEAAGYNPNAVALNPADYAALDVAAAAASNSGPTRRTSFWGLTTVAAGAIPPGSAFVGDFTAGMQLFDRGVSDVFLSDSHADLFIKNILVILAETRVKTAITDPLALCECTESA